jgi:hypothetical protein
MFAQTDIHTDRQTDRQTDITHFGVYEFIPLFSNKGKSPNPTIGLGAYGIKCIVYLSIPLS